MDSLTQIVLGAAVGEVVLGKKAGNKAMLFGAIAGTLPDLDVVLSLWFKDDLSEITLHRGYSHALFVHVLLAWPLAWMCFKAYQQKYTFKDWYLLWALGLTTHAILDSFTTYGTRLFLPFSSTPIGFNNISVIDPLYTLPFMGILIYCLFLKRENPLRAKWAWRSILLSSSYMLATFGVKAYVHQRFAHSLQAQALPYQNLSTSPTFFNNALWVGMGISDSAIYMGEYSVLESPQPKTIQLVKYPRHLSLEKGFEGEALNTLKWFSQGAYLLEKPNEHTLNVFVVKWGRSNYMETEPEKAFVFYYQLIKKDQTVELHAMRPKMTKLLFKMALSQLWNRIWTR